MQDAIIIIPARYASTRFPAKPLAEIAGKSLVQRVWEIATSALDATRVYVATDHQEIFQHVEQFGGQAVMTPEDCKNGSERVDAAIQELKLSPEIVINLQGDAVLTPPWVINDLIQALANNQQYLCATPAVQISSEEYNYYQDLRAKNINSGTFVVFDQNQKALYFSSAIIPYQRSKTEELNVFRHIGIYAYRQEGLKKYLSLEESKLENIEKLEQLRLLENGIDILVETVDLQGRTMASVDTPEDVTKAEKIIKKEGELV